MSKLEYRDIKQPNYRHVGKYTPRKDAKDIVTGKAIFLDDFSVPHMLYGKTKRSPYPHARILSIDTSRAEALPGVRAVITHKNMPEQWGLGLPVHRLLMEDKVYYVGDLVALIAADTVETAEEAIDLIDVEYEQLEAVYTAEDALKAPNRYSRICRKGIITCPDARSGPQPRNSRFQAPAVHRFTSYRLFRVCKCIASHTRHRITSLPAGFGQCFFAALRTELKSLFCLIIL